MSQKHSIGILSPLNKSMAGWFQVSDNGDATNTWCSPWSFLSFFGVQGFGKATCRKREWSVSGFVLGVKRGDSLAMQPCTGPSLSENYVTEAQAQLKQSWKAQLFREKHFFEGTFQDLALQVRCFASHWPYALRFRRTPYLRQQHPTLRCAAAGRAARNRLSRSQQPWVPRNLLGLGSPFPLRRCIPQVLLSLFWTAAGDRMLSQKGVFSQIPWNAILPWVACFRCHSFPWIKHQNTLFVQRRLFTSNAAVQLIETHASVVIHTPP